MKYLLIIIMAMSCSMMKQKKKTSKRFKALKREAELGKRVSVRLLKSYPRLDDESSQTYISSLGRSIVHRLGRQELYYYFAIVQGKQKNSYSAPGGFVFVTTGLLKSIQSEAELVGILSREISHINNKDLYKAVANEKDMAKAADQAWGLLKNIKLDKKDIMRADQEAVLGMVTMSYDPKKYTRVARNKSYVKKIVQKMSTKVSQNNGSRFRQLKNRI